MCNKCYTCCIILYCHVLVTFLLFWVNWKDKVKWHIPFNNMQHVCLSKRILQKLKLRFIRCLFLKTTVQSGQLNHDKKLRLIWGNENYCMEWKIGPDTKFRFIWGIQDYCIEWKIGPWHKIEAHLGIQYYCMEWTIEPWHKKIKVHLRYSKLLYTVENWTMTQN